jgi:bla regulator protein blaR1
MSHLVSFVASYAINSLWQVPLVAGAGWVASWLVKRVGPAAQHVTWVVTLALAVLMPVLPLWRLLPGLVRAHEIGDGRSSIALIGGAAGANGPGVTMLPGAFVLGIFLLYAGALLYFAARLVWSVYWTAALVRDAQALSLDAASEEVWSRCKRAFSVGEARVVGSGRVGGPVTIGFGEPVLLMPVGFFEGCTIHDLLAALAHECAHIKRRDFQKNLIYEFVGLLIAFHPVTWMLKSRIAQTREMICDDMAVSRVIDPHIYTQSLVRLAARMFLTPRVSSTHAIGIFDANILEKRIMTITTKKPQLSVAVKYGLMVPGALLLLSVATVGAAKTVVIQPETQAQTSDAAKPYGQVYHIGKDVIAPKLIFSVEPEFPESERKSKSKFEGTCLIGFVVDESGMPRDVKVVRSLSADFDTKAVEAVEQYRFTPAMKAGEPVAVTLKVEVKFERF